MVGVKKVDAGSGGEGLEKENNAKKYNCNDSNTDKCELVSQMAVIVEA